MVTIETPRLVLRRWRQEDVPAMAAVNADPEVMRWIGDGRVQTPEETRRAVERIERTWDTEGFGLFAVELRETGELAGFTGLAVPLFLPEVLPAVEIGWRLGRSFWGRGIATEAATAALRFGFEACGRDRIISIARIGNTASERVMAKLGLRPERETTVPGNGTAVRVHELTRADYLARPRP
ncbi:GNAT family N-acetyltransferase [Kitasatospora aureofaciens]|uniref:GNAT family N-acetyltransferase n=1 Tax=Kitasatospora aureofaciens TaxID=1894 RepID=UPI000997A738|nr:GNAT family N-acetyltransferase [Kitasatospora aureofaciens]HJD82367.1 GNAT family N-acetyltransferase [Kitasatospora aureofaciens]